MKASVEGPFFRDSVFHLLFGLERTEVAYIIDHWDGINIFIDSDVALAINNAMGNLTGYPHKQNDIWDEWISISKTQVSSLFDKWYHMVEWVEKPIIIVKKRDVEARSRWRKST